MPRCDGGCAVVGVGVHDARCTTGWRRVVIDCLMTREGEIASIECFRHDSRSLKLIS